MNLHFQLQHERRLLRRHKDGYLCARLSSLLVLALAGCLACLSLQAVGELLLGPHPLALGRGLEGAQTSLLLSHVALSVLALCVAALALGLWRLDWRAWWITLALSVPPLLGGPGAAYAHLVLLLTLLLLACHRTFQCHAAQQ